MQTKLVIRRRRVLPQFNPSTLGLPVMATMIVFMAALVFQQAQGISLTMLTEDASALQGSAWFKGMISTLGICLLAAATGISFFAGNFRRKIHGGLRKTSALVWLSLCSLLLLADDALMIHETIAQRTSFISETVVQALIGLTIIATLLVFHRAISVSFLYAIPALLCWCLSVVVDGAGGDLSSTAILVEDGAKFLGILLWFTFILDLANRYFVDVIASRTIQQRL